MVEELHGGSWQDHLCPNQIVMGHDLEVAHPKQLSICMPESELFLCFPRMPQEWVVRLSVWEADMHLFILF